MVAPHQLLGKGEEGKCYAMAVDPNAASQQNSQIN